MIMNLDYLYQEATSHRHKHNCSAHPYKEYERLYNLIKSSKPMTILEIGTGIGFTSIVMALASPQALIDTLEKDNIHAEMARDFISKISSEFGLVNLNNQITIYNRLAETFLSTLQANHYDLIFFDGYQIHHEFLPHYNRLLKKSGLLIIGNNHLGSKTSDQFWEELGDGRQWKILESFADTTLAQKFI